MIQGCNNHIFADCLPQIPRKSFITGILDTRTISIAIIASDKKGSVKGIHFKTLVQQGDSVRTGDKLLEFDRDALLAAGYNIVTPMVITNSGENQKVTVTAEGNVNFGDCVMETVW